MKELKLTSEEEEWINLFCGMKHYLEKKLGYKISLGDFLDYLRYCREVTGDLMFKQLCEQHSSSKRPELG